MINLQSFPSRTTINVALIPLVRIIIEKPTTKETREQQRLVARETENERKYERKNEIVVLKLAIRMEKENGSKKLKPLYR